jgi:hypothetical protein
VAGPTDAGVTFVYPQGYGGTVVDSGEFLMGVGAAVC